MSYTKIISVFGFVTFRSSCPLIKLGTKTAKKIKAMRKTSLPVSPFAGREMSYSLQKEA